MPENIPILRESKGQLFKLKEAAAYLRVSRSTFHRMILDGKVSGHKVGYTWRFWEDDLMALFQSEGQDNHA
jgi:excisionase family DNA binding protein